MGSLETVAFDATYYALAGALAIIVGYTTILGFRIRRTLVDSTNRDRALGVGLAAIGVAVSLYVGVSMDAMAKSGFIGDLFYQQAHFSIFYLGFGLMLYGIDVMIFSGRHPRIRALMWVAYLATVAISAANLLNLATYTISYSGGMQHVAQQQVFFLPLFLVLIFGIIGMQRVASESEDRAQRWQSISFGLFASLVFVGMLREATIIPSSGDPFVDLLLAFVPFTIGSICLLISATSLRHVKLGAASQVETAI
jgi:hypothetical protein